MALVEAVSVMPSEIGCHKLSTLIRLALPNISDARKSRSADAESFNRAKTKKNDRQNKKVAESFYDYSQFVKAMTSIKKIMFREEKLNASELTKKLNTFNQYRQSKSRCIHR